MRKQLSDRLRGKGARLTVLISDACNVRAVAHRRVAVDSRFPAGENPVLRDLLLRHTGFVDVSGSSRDQFGWYSAETGGWFTNALCYTADPAQFPGTAHVSWDQFLTRVSDNVSRDFQRRRNEALQSGNIVPRLRMQTDLRPQRFTLDVRSVR